MDIARVAAIPYTIITPGVVAFHFALAAAVLARADR